jgi:hypothetical protein
MAGLAAALMLDVSATAIFFHISRRHWPGFLIALTTSVR